MTLKLFGVYLLLALNALGCLLLSMSANMYMLAARDNDFYLATLIATVFFINAVYFSLKIKKS